MKTLLFIIFAVPLLLKAQIVKPAGFNQAGQVVVSSYTVSDIKRVDRMTATTNTAGIVSFTFAAFTTTPNIQYSLGYPANKEERIFYNAAPTTTSVIFQVQLRTDILGALPSYSNVNGREVSVVLYEK